MHIDRTSREMITSKNDLTVTVKAAGGMQVIVE
jgi:hypothetical protein